MESHSSTRHSPNTAGLSWLRAIVKIIRWTMVSAIVTLVSSVTSTGLGMLVLLGWNLVRRDAVPISVGTVLGGLLSGAGGGLLVAVFAIVWCRPRAPIAFVAFIGGPTAAQPIGLLLVYVTRLHAVHVVDIVPTWVGCGVLLVVLGVWWLLWGDTYMRRMSELLGILICASGEDGCDAYSVQV